MKRYFVYMLLCADGKFYVGITNDVERPVREHEGGADPEAFTFGRRPTTLVYSQEFQWVQHAIAWEKQLKKWSSKKKMALVDGDFDQIHELARCLNDTSHEMDDKGSG